MTKKDKYLILVHWTGNAVHSNLFAETFEKRIYRQAWSLSNFITYRLYTLWIVKLNHVLCFLNISTLVKTKTRMSSLTEFFRQNCLKVNAHCEPQNCVYEQHNESDREVKVFEVSTHIWKGKANTTCFKLNKHH
jgi:hypothetical protein